MVTAPELFEFAGCGAGLYDGLGFRENSIYATEPSFD
jgi:hypothetical protein